MKRTIEEWREVKPESLMICNTEHILRMLEYMRSDILELGAQIEQAKALLEIRKGAKQ